MSESLIAIITAVVAIQTISGTMIIAALTPPDPDFNELFAFVHMLFGIHYRFVRKLRNRRLNCIGIIIACTICYVFIAQAAILWFIVALLVDIFRIALKLFFWTFRERENYNE